MAPQESFLFSLTLCIGDPGISLSGEGVAGVVEQATILCSCWERSLQPLKIQRTFPPCGGGIHAKTYS